MDPNVWNEPEQFRPERFLDQFGKVVGKELIMPFSIGTQCTLCLKNRAAFIFYDITLNEKYERFKLIFKSCYCSYK